MGIEKMNKKLFEVEGIEWTSWILQKSTSNWEQKENLLKNKKKQLLTNKTANGRKKMRLIVFKSFVKVEGKASGGEC